MKIMYEPHPVSPERKKELRGQGFKIIDAMFMPKGHVKAEAGQRPDDSPEGVRVDSIDSAIQPPVAKDLPVVDGLDELDAAQLHALAKERGLRVHHASGADKVREALRGAAQ